MLCARNDTFLKKSLDNNRGVWYSCSMINIFKGLRVAKGYLSQKLINQNNTSVIDIIRKQYEKSFGHTDIKYVFGFIITDVDIEGDPDYVKREGPLLTIYAVGV